MVVLLFWGAVAFIAYSYLVFPGLTLVRARWFPRPIHPQPFVDLPSVSLVIAAHDEANSIGAKLDNVLALDYPANRLEVIVASDGSTDDTEDIVRGYEGRGVRLLALPRRGKAHALNAAVRSATARILVFSDANSMYEPCAIRALVESFSDDSVGGVAGDQRYLERADRTAMTEGEATYWNLDRILKRAQSVAGSVTSATGAIYAIRRELFEPVPEGVTDDFVTSTRVIARGARLVFAPGAIAREPVASSGRVELGRKLRVMTRGFESLWVMRRLMNPFRYGVYAVQLVSHKLCRRLVGFALLMLAVASVGVWERGGIYAAAGVAQLALYGAAAVGAVLQRTRVGRHKLLSLPLFFIAANLAAVLAALKCASGRRVVMWDPQRPSSRVS